MSKYALKLLIQMIPLLLGISLVSFTIMHLAPGGPMMIVAGDSEATLDPEQVALLRARYGLDQPIPVQFVKWLSNIARGDFGMSFIENRPVLDMIMERLPNTLYLNLVVLLVTYALTIPIGVMSALRQYSRFDIGVTTVAFWGQAMPNFWFALLLIVTFAIPIQWVPTSGMATHEVTLTDAGFMAVVLDRLKYLMLPAIVLITERLTGLTRYMRASMLEVVGQDYVRTARAKGLSERVVIYRHALKNAILPIITLAGFTLSALFSGSVIVERIFSWPGVGNLSIQSIFQRDYSVVMAFNIIGATLTIMGMLLVDLAYAFIDPRIRFD
ncbi:MAG: ABC transporter permease [Thermaerobacterales bacterium]